MNKRFKIIYYFLVALFTVVFSYQIYLLVYTIIGKPHYEVGFLATGDE